jgi:hypothetical protein
LIVLPKVLAELDDRKRDARTRDAAQKVLAQLDDFDRRGDTRTGVPLRGKFSYREVVAHADMTHTLPGLRADIPDDVIVAGRTRARLGRSHRAYRRRRSDRGVRNKARTGGMTVMRTADIG